MSKPTKPEPKDKDHKHATEAATGRVFPVCRWCGFAFEGDHEGVCPLRRAEEDR